MGQLNKDFALLEEKIAPEEISEGQREECASPNTSRVAQNPATAPTQNSV